MAKMTSTTRLPRGTNALLEAAKQAMEVIPAGSRSEVSAAFISKWRDYVRESRAGWKGAASSPKPGRRAAVKSPAAPKKIGRPAKPRALVAKKATKKPGGRRKDTAIPAIRQTRRSTNSARSSSMHNDAPAEMLAESSNSI